MGRQKVTDLITMLDNQMTKILCTRAFIGRFKEVIHEYLESTDSQILVDAIKANDVASAHHILTTYEKTSLQLLPFRELVQIAKSFSVRNYSRLNRQQLERSIREARQIHRRVRAETSPSA
jgi:hypothetical protein